MEIGKQDTGLRSYAVKRRTIDIDFLAYFSWMRALGPYRRYTVKSKYLRPWWAHATRLENALPPFFLYTDCSSGLVRTIPGQLYKCVGFACPTLNRYRRLLISFWSSVLYWSGSNKNEHLWCPFCELPGHVSPHIPTRIFYAVIYPVCTRSKNGRLILQCEDHSFVFYL